MHSAPPCDLGRHVAAGVHPGERHAPARAVPTTPQRWRISVEHLSTGEGLTGPGVTQDQSIAEDQRQPPVQGQSAMIVVERSQPGGHGRGSDVHEQLGRGFGQRASRDAAHVEDARARPRVGCDQRVAAVDGVAGHPAQVQRDPGYRSDGGYASPRLCSPRIVTDRFRCAPSRSSRSPEASVPAASVPVTTVPAPVMVKERSTHSRTRAVVSGGGSSARR